LHDMHETSLVVAAMMGLLSGAHCFAMCGGIAGALVFSLPLEARQSRFKLASYLALYSLGRISSYALAGAVLGLIGAATFSSLSPAGGHEALRGLAAVILIAIGMNIGGWLPQLSRLENLGDRLWRRIEPWGRRLLPVRSPLHALLYGIIWGWLPCTMVYSTLFWASTSGGAIEGGALMLSFGVGTLPALLSAGALTRFISELGQRQGLRQAAGILIIAFAGLGWIYSGGCWIGPSPACAVR
jgi:sulfite exporter TauE/SafE